MWSIGHCGMRADIDVSAAPVGQVRWAEIWRNKGERKRARERKRVREASERHICKLYELILWTSLCTQHWACPPKHKEEIRSAAAVLFY